MAYNGYTSRRAVIGALTAGILTPSLGFAHNIPAHSLLDRANIFLAALTSEQIGEARFEFDNPVRLSWNLFGPRVKPGLRLERMDPAQQHLALDLLKSLLSNEGMAKFHRVRSLQEVLRERGAGPADRNANRYSFAVFGTPVVDAVWGFRVEGHHLSLSFTMRGNTVISTTPSSFSSNPNEVSGGRFDGLIALREEHTLATQLMNDLGARQQDVARISERAIRNIMTVAGREGRLFDSRREGLPLDDMSVSQRDMAMRLIDVYSSDHLVSPLAEEQKQRVRSGDVESIRLAWAGGSELGDMMYYRLHGETFVIEFATNPGEPYHLHTVRHDIQRHLGRHVVAI